MNKELVAKELVRIAKDLVAMSGQVVAVNELPRGIQMALQHIPYNRRDIEVRDDDSYSPSMASASFEGNRGFVNIVDISTGRVEQSDVGSFGGSNPFENSPVDNDSKRYPIQKGKVVILGETGGRGTFVRILARPDDMDLVVTQPLKAIDLIEQEAKALHGIAGIKSGYRQDEFRRKGLGDYNKNNPLIQSLEKKGMIKFTSVGISVTTDGMNAHRKLSHY